MGYYVKENGVVVRKECEDPRAARLKSYYRPNDGNVYHCEDTPEEAEYNREQRQLEDEYLKAEYFRHASEEERTLLKKAGFLVKSTARIYYRKWHRADDVHWCTARPYISRIGEKKLIYKGSSWQEFEMKDYGEYWAFDKRTSSLRRE